MPMLRSSEPGSTALRDGFVQKAAQDLAAQQEAYIIQEVSKSPLFQFFIQCHFVVLEKSGGPQVKVDGERLSVTQEIGVRRSWNLLKVLKFLAFYPFYFFRRRIKAVKSEEVKQ